MIRNLEESPAVSITEPAAEESTEAGGTENGAAGDGTAEEEHSGTESSGSAAEEGSPAESEEGGSDGDGSRETAAENPESKPEESAGSSGESESGEAGKETESSEAGEAPQSSSEGETAEGGEIEGTSESADTGGISESAETDETSESSESGGAETAVGESGEEEGASDSGGGHAGGWLDVFDGFFQETEADTESVSAADEETTAEYIIGQDGETQIILTTEPETAYVVSTPANADKGVLSKTYSVAAKAITKTAQSAAESAKPALKTLGFNIINAVLILFIGLQLAKLVRKMLSRTFEKVHMDGSLRSFLSSIIYVLICGVSAFMALERLGVSSASIVALLGSAGLAVSLSLQDFLGNFAGGVIIMILKPFRAGDYIVCGDAEGTVSATSLFYTTLNTIDNRQMILPNGALSNANIINVTAETKRRLEIRVQVSYDSDLRRAKEILKRMFDECPDIFHDEEVQVFVDSLGDSGITLVGRGWIAKENYWTTKWAMTENLKYAYDEAGIEIPFTQMVVHMKNGGEPDSRGDAERGRRK